MVADCQEKFNALSKQLRSVGAETALLGSRVQLGLASALILWSSVAEKVTPLIKPLMDSIKSEPIKEFLDLSIRSLVKLLDLCSSRTPCPNSKILKNLGIFVCSSVAKCPLIGDFVNKKSVFFEVLDSPVLAVDEISLTAENSLNVLRSICQNFGTKLPDTENFQELTSLYVNP